MRYQIVRATILIRVEVILSEHVGDEICMSVSSLLGGKARPERHGCHLELPLKALPHIYNFCTLTYFEA